MNDRRITSKTEEPREDRLKHIAGLIQKLTYTEMHRFSELLQKHEQLAEDDGYPEALLKVADDILTRDDSKHSLARLAV
ncbi:hypothetical protein HJA82_29390 [Rhizobium bangladeshense]|uniref:hypothetical protein n=1 Tax=Rhizobium bangladeshense TaxID=1138189 RepID=UPI001C82AD1B|nr:hypothetical protein [Rhizobium bangladeshense]MBX4911430.1 hypothetical protein [Rhizobium bangladeshense]